MIEILAECGRIQLNTSQKLADQVRIILKKSWFPDVEALENCEQLNSEEYNQDPLSLIKKLKAEKLDDFYRIETQKTEN